MAARGVGGATDRNSLSTREANGATMLVEVDTAAVAKLLLVWIIAEVREVSRKPACQEREVSFIETKRRGHLQNQTRGSR